MRRRATAAVLAWVLLAGLTGCGESKEEEPGVERSQVGVQEMREQVTTDVRELRDALAEAGMPASRARGEYLTCGSVPDSSYEYRAGMDVADLDDVAAGIARVSELLKAAGWEVESEGSDPEPYANLTRGAVRVNVLESRRDPGVLGIDVVHDCVQAPTDQAGDLLGDPEQL